MHFGSTLDLSNIDLWNIDLLDTHLNLLDTDISSKHFVCLQDVFKVSSRHIFKTLPQGKSSRRLQGMSSRRLQDMSSIRLEDVFSVTIFCRPRCLLQEVFKMSYKISSRRLQDIFARCLGRQKITMLKIFNTSKCLLLIL